VAYKDVVLSTDRDASSRVTRLAGDLAQRF
jgi:hypothetical protein